MCIRDRYYTVSYRGKTLMQPSELGITRTDATFYKDLQWMGNSMADRVNEAYAIKNAKKSYAVYTANRQFISVKNQAGEEMQLAFQVSNDGVAFRYIFSGKTTGLKYITKEHSSFHFYEGTRAWLQPKTEAQRCV